VLDSATPATSRRPRALVAALLGLPMTGLGHVYARRPGLAVLIAALAPLVPPAAIYGGIHRTFAGAVALAVGIVLLVVGTAAHAAYLCRTSPGSWTPRLRMWLQYVGFVAFVLVWMQVSLALSRRTVATLCVHALRMTTDSLSPTLAKGDFIVVDACRPDGPRPAASCTSRCRTTHEA
jgi:hypothetical protein